MIEHEANITCDQGYGKGRGSLVPLPLMKTRHSNKKLLVSDTLTLIPEIEYSPDRLWSWTEF